MFVFSGHHSRWNVLVRYSNLHLITNLVCLANVFFSGHHSRWNVLARYSDLHFITNLVCLANVFFSGHLSRWNVLVRNSDLRFITNLVCLANVCFSGHHSRWNPWEKGQSRKTQDPSLLGSPGKKMFWSLIKSLIKSRKQAPTPRRIKGGTLVNFTPKEETMQIEKVV